MQRLTQALETYLEGRGRWHAQTVRRMPPAHLLNYLKWRVEGLSERRQRIFDPVLRCRSEETTRASQNERALAAIVRRPYSWKFDGGREKHIGRCSHAKATCDVKQGDKIMRILPLQHQPPLRAACAAGAACAPPPAPGGEITGGLHEAGPHIQSTNYDLEEMK
eukprot:4681743-Pleurochrysis_carterae.AAC.1